MRRSLTGLLGVFFVAVAAAEPPKAPTQFAFLRTQDLTGPVAALQTLSAEYKPLDRTGPSIWLIGVAHLGTRDYYSALQKRLDAQSAVLFEGIDAHRLQQGAKVDASKGLQGQLADALGLVFQLDGIDYQRPHFRNTDMTAADLNEAIERRATVSPEPDESPTAANSADAGKPAQKTPGKVDNATFNQLMQALHGEGDMAASLGGMISLMGSTPEMRETSKLMLIEALGQAGELIDVAKAASPEMKDLFDVLITERNEEVLRQLRNQLARLGPGQSVAIFYGAAHMDELAKRLGSELRYGAAAQQWDTAFTADSTKSIMPAGQIRMLLQMMKAQMQTPAAPGQESLQMPLLNLFKPSGK